MTTSSTWSTHILSVIAQLDFFWSAMEEKHRRLFAHQQDSVAEQVEKNCTNGIIIQL